MNFETRTALHAACLWAIRRLEEDIERTSKARKLTRIVQERNLVEYRAHLAALKDAAVKLANLRPL